MAYSPWQGNTAYRVLIPVSSIAGVKDFPTSTAWWHGQDGHFYFSHVDDEFEQELCEITIRSYNEPVTPDRTATWAVPVTNEHVLARCGVSSMLLRMILVDILLILWLLVGAI